MWLNPKMKKHVTYLPPAHQRLRSIKHLIAEPLNAAYMSLLWLFLQTLLMSICCKPHVQSPLVSAQPHTVFDFAYTNVSSFVTWPKRQDSNVACDLANHGSVAPCVSIWAVLGGETANIWWCDSRCTWTVTPVRFTTQCQLMQNSKQWH